MSVRLLPKDGYWIFSPGYEELAYQRGFRAPELILLAELREPGKATPDDINLRWIPGTKDIYFPERHLNAKQHLAEIIIERRLFGLPPLDTSAVPVYPCDVDGKLLPYRQGVPTVCTRSCGFCHDRKWGCDKKVPACEECVKRGIICEYPPDGRVRTKYIPASVAPEAQNPSTSSDTAENGAEKINPSASFSEVSNNLGTSPHGNREEFQHLLAFRISAKAGPYREVAAAETGLINTPAFHETVQPGPQSSRSPSAFRQESPRTLLSTPSEQGGQRDPPSSIAEIIGYDSDDEAGINLPDVHEGVAETDSLHCSEVTQNVDGDASATLPELDFTITGSIDPSLLVPMAHADMMELSTPQTDEIRTPVADEHPWGMHPYDFAILKKIGEDLAVDFPEETMNLPVACIDCGQMEDHIPDCNINKFMEVSRADPLSMNVLSTNMKLLFHPGAFPDDPNEGGYIPTMEEMASMIRASAEFRDAVAQDPELETVGDDVLPLAWGLRNSVEDIGVDVVWEFEGQQYVLAAQDEEGEEGEGKEDKGKMDETE